MVWSDPDFTGQPQVINGASYLFVEVFGEAGRHARSAVGMAALPMGIPVEVELVCEIDAAWAGTGSGFRLTPFACQRRRAPTYFFRVPLLLEGVDTDEGAPVWGASTKSPFPEVYADVVERIEEDEVTRSAAVTTATRGRRSPPLRGGEVWQG